MVGQAGRQPEQKQEAGEELMEQEVSGQRVPSEGGTLLPLQLVLFSVES